MDKEIRPGPCSRSATAWAIGTITGTVKALPRPGYPVTSAASTRPRTSPTAAGLRRRVVEALTCMTASLAEHGPLSGSTLL
jgi:hypothetical protein